MINSIGLDEACTRLLEAARSATAGNIICAGLSMAPPSNLPSAAALAERAREKHIQLLGPAGAAVPTRFFWSNPPAYFFGRHELETYFIRALIDRHTFSCSPPNPGHLAVADLLITQAAEAAVSTNVDRPHRSCRP